MTHFLEFLGLDSEADCCTIGDGPAFRTFCDRIEAAGGVVKFNPCGRIQPDSIESYEGQICISSWRDNDRMLAAKEQTDQAAAAEAAALALRTTERWPTMQSMGVMSGWSSNGVPIHSSISRFAR